MCLLCLLPLLLSPLLIKIFQRRGKYPSDHAWRAQCAEPATAKPHPSGALFIPQSRL